MDRIKSNPVAKYARKYNTAVVMADRKRRVKAGYRKHKKTFDNL